MARLPIPGGDTGNWGTILNDYLSQSLNPNGLLQDNAVTNSAIAPDAVTSAEIADGSVQEAKLANTVQTKLNQTAPTWTTLSGKPAVVAAGATQIAARATINAVDAAALPVDLTAQPGWNATPGADNGALAQSVLDTLYGQGGGTIYLNGILCTTQQLVLGSGVRIIGANPKVGIIRAIAGFPAGTAMVRLDRTGTTNQFYNRIQSITVDANNIADACVIAYDCQEQGGIIDCRLVKWMVNGATFSGNTCMHFNFDDVWCYSSTSAAPTATGLNLTNLGDNVSIDRVTVVNTANNTAGVGVEADAILVSGSTGIVFKAIHLEGGSIRFDNSSGTIIGASGHSTVPSVVRLTSTTSRVDWHDIERAGSTNTVSDSTSGTAQIYTNSSGSVGMGQLIIGTSASSAERTTISAAGKTGTVALEEWKSPTLTLLARVLRDGTVESRANYFNRRSDGSGGYQISDLGGSTKWQLRWDLTSGAFSLRNSSGTDVFTVSQAGAVQINSVDVAVKLSATAVLNFPSVAAQSFQDLTVTVAGAVIGDSIALGVPATAVTAGIVYSAWASAADTVTVRAHNYTAGALDPASGTFKTTVVR